MIHDLKTSISWSVNLVSVAARQTPPEAGFVIHMLRRPDGELVAVLPDDGYNFVRLMSTPGMECVGIGRAVEAISTEWFVAWRPFSPRPELVTLKD